MYGPQSCDAVLDESGNAIYLIYNALGELEATFSSQGLYSVDAVISPYGPQFKSTSIPLNLLSYAESLCWHSRGQDPTGLIWMGARYYNPETGRFLSPDPISYPLSLDLYAYANGDPVNYLDLDGRFASPVYQALKSNLIMTDLSKYVVNKTLAWATDKGLASSHSFTVDGFSIPGLGFGWINGIQNSYTESFFSCQYLSQLGGGVKISGVYNAKTLSSFIPLASKTRRNLSRCVKGNFFPQRIKNRSRINVSRDFGMFLDKEGLYIIQTVLIYFY